MFIKNRTFYLILLFPQLSYSQDYFIKQYMTAAIHSAAIGYGLIKIDNRVCHIMNDWANNAVNRKNKFLTRKRECFKEYGKAPCDFPEYWPSPNMEMEMESSDTKEVALNKYILTKNELDNELSKLLYKKFSSIEYLFSDDFNMDDDQSLEKKMNTIQKKIIKNDQLIEKAFHKKCQKIDSVFGVQEYSRLKKDIQYFHTMAAAMRMAIDMIYFAPLLIHSAYAHLSHISLDQTDRMYYSAPLFYNIFPAFSLIYIALIFEYKKTKIEYNPTKRIYHSQEQYNKTHPLFIRLEPAVPSVGHHVFDFFLRELFFIVASKINLPVFYSVLGFEWINLFFDPYRIIFKNKID